MYMNGSFVRFCEKMRIGYIAGFHPEGIIFGGGELQEMGVASYTFLYNCPKFWGGGGGGGGGASPLHPPPPPPPPRMKPCIVCMMSVHTIY